MPHRYKSYAAETGDSYRYFFAARHPVARPEGQGRGSDFTFVIAADQQAPFTVRIFVSDRAMTSWRELHGQELTPNEQYAVAKMRLFRAFDEAENLREERLDLVVDENNVAELLEPLELA